MQVTFNQALRVMNKRSRSGQSIILVAFAFILLIAFVGIAVDVGMLFIRYSSLSRAVDSAAIAVAGQVKSGVNFVKLNATAQEYIKLQGNGALDVNSVLVETCETDIYNFVQAYMAFPGSGGAQPTKPFDDLVPSPPAFTRPDALANTMFAPNSTYPNGYPPTKLCQLDPQKLVRVSAQMDSPTTFLSLLGWRSVRLVATATSQTAVLDVALVLDTSWSMHADTFSDEADLTKGRCDRATTFPIYSDYGVAAPPNYVQTCWAFTDFTLPPTNSSSVPGGVGLHRYDPTQATAHDGIFQNAGSGGPQPAIRAECATEALRQNNYVGAIPPPSGPISGFAANYAWSGCCNTPGQLSYPASVTSTTLQQKAIDAFNQHIDPNFWIRDDPTYTEAWIRVNGDDSTVTTDPNWGAHMINGLADPYNYSALICQPFKRVRDAARHFIENLDFVRGDRIVLVTFAGRAQTVMPLNQSVPILLDKNDAIRTLNFQVGVDVEHDWVPKNLDITKGPIDLTMVYAGGQSRCSPNDDYSFGNYPYDYWRVTQCNDTDTGGGIRQARIALTNAEWVRREAVWVIVMLSDGFPNRTDAYTPTTSGFNDALIQGDPHYRVYEEDDYTIPAPGLTAECDNYIPGPMLANSKPQICPGWGTTPVTPLTYPPQYIDPQNPANPHSFGICPMYTYCGPITDAPPTQPLDWYGTPYSYCASQNWTSRAGGVTIPANDYRPFYDGTTPPPTGFERWSSGFSGCTATDPDARHFCMNPQGVINPSTSATVTISGTTVVNPNYDPNAAKDCDPRYDAADYARDQADYAGLLKYVDAAADNSGGRDVPGNFIAMFTIFFSHSGAATLDDGILGVKVLRYIADAGDNGTIDNPLQSWYRQHHWANYAEPSVANVWAAAPAPPAGYTQPVYKALTDVFFQGSATTATTDPCDQYDYNDQSPATRPMPPAPSGSTQIGANDAVNYEKLARTSCGQYYYAKNLSDIDKAFFDISGRLFTRLSR